MIDELRTAGMLAAGVAAACVYGMLCCAKAGVLRQHPLTAAAWCLWNWRCEGGRIGCAGGRRREGNTQTRARCEDAGGTVH